MQSEMNNGVTEQIRNLELKLLDPSVRSSHKELDALLADDLFEIGSSGRTYDKAAIIEALRNEVPVETTLTGFGVTMIAENAALALFRISAKTPEPGKMRVTLRSSIWRKEIGSWRLVFHQATL